MNELQNLMGKDKKVLFDRNHIKCKRFDGIEKKEVIVAHVLKGNGTEDDPYYISDLYFDENCKPLFEVDLKQILANEISLNQR